MKRFLFAVMALVMSFVAMADNVQPGYVKTRGRMGADGKVIAGRRLDAAVIVLQGGGSVRSGADGSFTLKAPSARFYLKDVKKQGYLVSDPDVLSRQYACSANPLILVLDEPAAQQDDKLASERRLRRTLQRQLQEREDELEALRDSLTQEQYRTALQQIYTDQENNEKFISEMAERYSRIDFDQLDEFQRQVTAYIQNGELARADSLLRTKGTMEQRMEEIQQLNRAIDREQTDLNTRQQNLDESRRLRDATIDDFAADCYHHFELCKMRFQNDSAAYYLRLRAQAAPENVDYKLEAGAFVQIYLAQYDLALEYYNNALTFAKENNESNTNGTLDENLSEIARSYNHIGILYLDQGNYVLARENFEKSLNIRLAILSENHPDVAASYNNLGVIYYNQGDYVRALENYEGALKILLTILGEKHPDVAASYGNIGNLYYKQGDYSRALENHEKSLKIRLATLGEHHPDVAASYNNLGVLYLNQGDYTRALENYERALKILSTILGEQHPDVAARYSNIGNVYYKQGDYSRALENYEKSLKIMLTTLGENHPYIAASYNNIGVIYFNQGDYVQALENYERALKILLTILGEKHPDVAARYNNIGALYYKQGDYVRALENYEKGLAIYLSNLGEEHETIRSLREIIQMVREKMAED